ncbi:UDP-glucose/GDP-mannose dehydrogenase family protein [Candidatus Woesearchaeota archaeon]|nr:UDP-glucose/GDP-mannose dehydrogenase family protein [Candidatus Woesearchaeota archaeon]
MRITIFGTGYVGLVSGVCFADMGNDVLCADVDTKKIALLERGANPIYEPGLQEKLDRNKKEGRLNFTTDLTKAVAYGDLLFICVGTPSDSNGSVDTQYVEAVAKTIGEQLNHDAIIVDKSTVPVGTAAKVRTIIQKELDKRKVKHSFSVVSNPEFLREGAAVNDFFNPDRVIVGIEDGDDHARELIGKLYKSVARTNRPLVFTDTKSAELIKYASNAMLATRISFMNQLSQYCETVGADITALSRGMGLDTRIGSRFLHAGVGYGGSCFPKDVKGLIGSIKEAGCDAGIFEAVDVANENQKRSLFPKIEKMLGTVKGKKVALWGLSFKPKTDDIREAPSRVIAQWLIGNGADVAAFDPEATENFKEEFPKIRYGKNPYDPVKGADLLILVTEWDAFRNPDWERVKKLMNTQNIIDGRNIYLGYRDDLEKLGFTYKGIGI